jgi:arylsulfatase
MMPVIGGSAQEIYGPEELVGGEMAGGKWMRQGSFKAVSIPAPYGDGNWRLFNVDEDPGETKNLAAEKPELLEVLKSAWTEYADDVGVIPAE